MSLNTTNLTRSVFLDRYGRYAKRTEDTYSIKLFYGTNCEPVTTLTKDQYTALTSTEKVLLNTLPGAPQCIETAGKSNA